MRPQSMTPTFQELETGWRTLWDHAEEISVGRNRLHWQDLEDRRQERAHRALSGRTHHSHAPGEGLGSQVLGYAARQAHRHGEGESGARTQARGDPASHAGRGKTVRTQAAEPGCGGQSAIAPTSQAWQAMLIRPL